MKLDTKENRLDWVIKLIPFGTAFSLTFATNLRIILTPINENGTGRISHYLIPDVLEYASVALLVVLTLVILKKHYWKHVFTVVGVLAQIGWIQFYDHRFSFGIGYLRIDLISFTFLAAHLILNYDIIRLFSRLFQVDEKTRLKDLEQKQQYYKNQVLRFERKFISKTSKELTQIIDENVLIPEALDAAKKLLNIRKENIN